MGARAPPLDPPLCIDSWINISGGSSKNGLEVHSYRYRTLIILLLLNPCLIIKRNEIDDTLLAIGEFIYLFIYFCTVQESNLIIMHRCDCVSV